MTAYLDDGDVRLYAGDCRDVMAGLAEGSVDAVVCDPPYGLGFMGKDWDSPGGTGDFPMRRTTEANTVNTGVSRQGGRQRSCEDFARRQLRDARSFQEWSLGWLMEAIRVLKPGGHLLAFGGTRTYHRLACAVEDAGFEVRDCLCWLYGSGFPKSLDVSKAIDKAAGAEREVRVNERWIERYPKGPGGNLNEGSPDQQYGQLNRVSGNPLLTSDPATPDAEQWQGWGTALKPAYEPIILARKPLVGTVAGNVLAHGTGALNIDGCRLAALTPDEVARSGRSTNGAIYGDLDAVDWKRDRTASAGRWPANVVLDEAAADLLDEQSGDRPSGNEGKDGHFRNQPPRENGGIYGGGRGLWQSPGPAGALYGDNGGASRFFYTAKASRSERGDDNTHPTVKPVALMRWLIRLATPPGGLILDPFLGSGTTAVAARLEGFRCIGIEQDEDYLAIAAARLGQQSLFANEAAS